MDKLFDKEILFKHTMFIDNCQYSLYILDDSEYYNIHILDDIHKQTELNTLRLQEPKDCITLDKLDIIFAKQEILQHYLWHSTYGYKDKMYSFNISVAEEVELQEV